jgi:hypothetical protein
MRTKTIVIILGMHRSGTSLSTQLINRFGAYIGEKKDLSPPSVYNADGNFENVKIVKLNNSFLKAYGHKWYSLGNFTYDFDDQRTSEYLYTLKKTLKEMLKNNDVIAIKDPRICLLLPLWQKTIDDLSLKAKYIYVVRNYMEVARSLQERNGFPIGYGLKLWGKYNLAVQEYLSDKNHLLLYYDDLMKNDAKDKIIYEYIFEKAYQKSNDGINVRKSGLRHWKTDNNDDGDNSVFARLYMCEIPTTDLLKLEYLFLPHKAVLFDIGDDNTGDLYIYGAGMRGREVSDYLESIGIAEYRFIDRDKTKRDKIINGHEIVSIDKVATRSRIIIAIENRTICEELMEILSEIEGVVVANYRNILKNE